MANFKYNPPTRDFCPVCLEIAENFGRPVIDTYEGKASSADGSPIHNWFYFVLGYSPAFPEYVFKREGINSSQLIADPFMGTGTTLVAARQNCINSMGIDANDFFIEVASTKTYLNVNKEELQIKAEDFLKLLERELSKFFVHSPESLFSDLNTDHESLVDYSQKTGQLCSKRDIYAIFPSRNCTLQKVY